MKLWAIWANVLGKDWKLGGELKDPKLFRVGTFDDCIIPAIPVDIEARGMGLVTGPNYRTVVPE